MQTNRAQSDLPTPANATRQPMPAHLTQSVPVHLARNQSFALDSDLILALQDMQASSGKPWSEFMQSAINEALRAWMGR